MNRIELLGRLTNDVEIKKGKESEYARFSLAVQRKTSKEKVDFIDCVAFGKLAEVIQKYCKKGQRIIVCGSLQIDSYENKEGKNVKATNVIVNDFYFTEFNKDLAKEGTNENPF